MTVGYEMHLDHLDPVFDREVLAEIAEARRTYISADHRHFLEVIRGLVDQPWGRLFLHYLIDRTGVWQNCNSPTAEGSRRVGLWLRNLIEEHHPDGYGQMVREAHERKHARQHNGQLREDPRG